MSRGCCREDDGDPSCFMNKNNMSEDMVKDVIYTQGCYYAVIDDLKNETIGLGVVLFIMAIVQVS